MWRSKDMMAVIYDLDGTAIDSASIQEDAWKYAAKVCKVSVTEDMLIRQRGMQDREAARMMGHDSAEFVSQKKKYIDVHIGEAKLSPGFAEAYEELRKLGVSVCICTASDEILVKRILHIIPVPLKNIVYSGMYANGKPDPEPLFVTCRMLELPPSECIYVGDAMNDYLAAKNAGMKVVCFGENKAIPKDVTRISDHMEILKMID